jgi:hypothetical protein
LPTGGNRKATCQSSVKNYLLELPDDYLLELPDDYLLELPDDYLLEQCNEIFSELM